MSVDNLLNQALNERGGSLDSSNLFAVVGDPVTGDIFVINLREYLSQNFRFYLSDESSCAVLMGAYNNEEDARKCIELIQDGKDHAPGLVGAKGWHILLWKSETEQLYTRPLDEYYALFTTLFKCKAKWKIIPLEIFTAKEAAEDTIEFIHLYIKDEHGNIIK